MYKGEDTFRLGGRREGCDVSYTMARYATARFPVKEAHEATWARRIALFFVQLLILTVLLHRFSLLTTPVALNLMGVSIAGFFLAIAIAIFSLIRIWFGGQTGAGQAFAAIVIAWRMQSVAAPSRPLGTAPMTFAISVGPGDAYLSRGVERPSFALSPDGQTLAFAGGGAGQACQTRT